MGSYEWLTPTKLPSFTKTPTSYKGSTWPLQITLLAGNQVLTYEPVGTILIQTIMLDLSFCLKNHSLTVVVKDHVSSMQAVFVLAEPSCSQSHPARTARSSPHRDKGRSLLFQAKF